MILKEKYQKEVIPEMKKKLGFKNNLAVPRITKVVVNIGIGLKYDDKQKEIIKKHLALITGQIPVGSKAKKSIASFKVRQGMIIGYSTTLRGKRMYDFLDRMINIAIPRMRDFRGLDLKAIDNSGNLTIGFREHIIFPEVAEEDDRMNLGFEVSVVTNAKTREQAVELFKFLGFPFRF